MVPYNELIREIVKSLVIVSIRNRLFAGLSSSVP